MKRQKLASITYAEHVVIGSDLKNIRERLLQILIRNCRSYGPGSKAALATDRVIGAVDKLRCELDSRLCQSLPSNNDSWRGVYYGSNEQK